MKLITFLSLAVIAVVVGHAMADVEQNGISQVRSSYSESFHFPIWKTIGSYLNITDTTNQWMLSFNQLKGISISLSVLESGDSNNNCRMDGYLVELATGTTYEFSAFVPDIPFTWVRSVPDVKWVNLQNVFIPITTGNLYFNITIKYADFWTNSQAEMDSGKSVGNYQGGNCTRESFRMIEGGFLQSKPFWIVLQLIAGQRLTFQVPSGYNCSYSRGTELVRNTC